jgi:FkbM family methyltransferase
MWREILNSVPVPKVNGKIVPKFSYREDFGMWWPLTDHKPEKCFHRVMSRHKDCDEVTRRCVNRRLAIQAGGHAGVWANRLARSFKKVLTFEPDPNLFQCLIRNTTGIENIQAFEQALGERSGQAWMLPHASAGSWRIDPQGTIEVPMSIIDYLGLEQCDAILLDVESYELKVLEGAGTTIDRFRPVILLEEGKRKHEIRDHMLKEFNYRPERKIHDDMVFLPMERPAC